MDKVSNPVLSPTREIGIKLEPCVQCGAPITDGYWGYYRLCDGSLGGVCSKTCSILHMKERENETNR